VESISLIFDATKELTLSPTAFEGMYNLRLLKIYYPPFLKDPSKEKIMNGKRVGIHLPRGLHFLSSELRFLYWYNYALKSFPSIFFPEKLVQLEMPCSQLEQLRNEGMLKSLKSLNLHGCSGLASLTHSIGMLKSLDQFDLNGCSRLASLPNNIDALKSLKSLHLSGCSGLVSLPNSIGVLKSLDQLDLSDCSRLASLPDSIGALKSLK
jgi:Leucine-rich repeat (LRR) protein